MSKSVLLVAMLVPLTVLAARHVGGNPRRLAATALPHEAGWSPARASKRWRCIVIHHSATEVGGAERFTRAHRARGFDELGYHFVVGNGSDTADGQVEVGPRWVTQKHGAHCKTEDEYYNEHGIGICLVGNFDHHPPSRAQTRSLQKLVRYLCHQYAIPADHVYTHGDITGKTRCPGEKFDLEQVRGAVR